MPAHTTPQAGGFRWIISHDCTHDAKFAGGSADRKAVATSPHGAPGSLDAYVPFELVTEQGAVLFAGICDDLSRAIAGGADLAALGMAGPLEAVGARHGCTMMRVGLPPAKPGADWVWHEVARLAQRTGFAPGEAPLTAQIVHLAAALQERCREYAAEHAVQIAFGEITGADILAHAQQVSTERMRAQLEAAGIAADAQTFSALLRLPVQRALQLLRRGSCVYDPARPGYVHCTNAQCAEAACLEPA